MNPPAEPADATWGRQNALAAVVRNVGTRYLMIGTEAAIGLLVLPFNIHHLGQSGWGLWMLMTSVSSYFSILDLGYGGSITKFVAQYRARRDADSLNEILSTLFVLFAVVGGVAYGAFLLVAYHVTSVFNVSPDQVSTGRALLLITGVYVSLGFPFSVYGGVTNGFQRYDINNMVAVGTSIVVAIVNVAMLSAGCTLVQLVAVTTGIRTALYLVYRRNAHRVFPALSIQPSRFRLARLREVTGFSIYVSIIDWANRLNYSIDAVIIGAFLGPAAVALWAVPQRIAEFLQRLTNQLNGVLFPVIVENDAVERPDRLRLIFVQGTRLSLFAVVPLTVALFILSGAIIQAWVGPQFAASGPITQVLVIVIAFRVGNATATTVLRGASRHQMLAFTNAVTALANVALSLLWIRRYGLIGQAFGTLVPVAFASVFVLFPAACRRVGITVGEAFREAVWPAVWPIAIMMAAIVPLRAVLPVTLPGLALLTVAGSVVYAGTFLGVAIGRDERQAYLMKAREIVKRRKRSRTVAGAIQRTA